MSAYIYNVLQSTASGKVEIINSSTKKWAVTKFIEDDFIKIGLSIDPLTIVRSIDGRPGSATHIDPYEFMKIDLGEE